MQLTAQDVVVALKIHALINLAKNPWTWSYPSIAEELAISVGGTYASVRRLGEANIVETKNGDIKVVRKKLFTLLVEAVPVMFFPRKGPVAMGMPTGLAALPLSEMAISLKWEPSPLPLIWPTSEGKVEGETLFPLHRIVPAAAQRHVHLYELCALVDVVRVGDSKQKKAASVQLEKRICP